MWKHEWWSEGVRVFEVGKAAFEKVVSREEVGVFQELREGRGGREMVALEGLQHEPKVGAQNIGKAREGAGVSLGPSVLHGHRWPCGQLAPHGTLGDCSQE